MPATKSPGPANYTLRPLIGFKDHDSNSTKQRGPQWSIGKQHGTGVEFTSPGPAVYTLDKLTRNGSVGIVGGTMFRKTKDLQSDLTPGPKHDAVNLSVYKNRSPSFSVRIKTREARIDTGPGPQNEPTPLDLYKNRMPKYPIFKRTEGWRSEDVPGSNSYNAGEAKLKVMKQNPAYSHKFLNRGMKSDKLPGPEYDLTKHNPFARGPAFSMRRKFCEYAHTLVVPADNCA